MLRTSTNKVGLKYKARLFFNKTEIGLELAGFQKLVLPMEAEEKGE